MHDTWNWSKCLMIFQVGASWIAIFDSSLNYSHESAETRSWIFLKVWSSFTIESLVFLSLLYAKVTTSGLKLREECVPISQEKKFQSMRSRGWCAYQKCFIEIIAQHKSVKNDKMKKITTQKSIFSQATRINDWSYCDERALSGHNYVLSRKVTVLYIITSLIIPVQFVV